MPKHKSIQNKKLVIAVIAPAGRLTEEELKSVLNELPKLSAKYNLEFKLYPAELQIRAKTKAKCLPFYAHNLEERTKAFVDSLSDEKVDLIWCLRGGYGSAEVVEKLGDKIANLKDLAANKILVGFSDITSLHILFNNIWKLPSVHATTLARSIKEDRVGEIISLVRAEQKSSIFKLAPLNQKAVSAKELQGKVLGGNLTVLASIVGTKLHPDLQGIIMIEDVYEYPYKIKRALEQLKSSGAFKEARAIVFGDFTPPRNATASEISKTLESFADETEIPVFRSLDLFGHGEKENKAFWLGVEGTIKCKANNENYQLEIPGPLHGSLEAGSLSSILLTASLFSAAVRTFCRPIFA